MKLLGAVVLIFGFSVLGFAQSKEKQFTLSGTISNKVDAVIYGIEIVAKNRDGRAFKAITNAEGFYEITMPYGKYTIEISSDGVAAGNYIQFYEPLGRTAKIGC